MKKWLRYKKFLKSGCWHVHTNFTDGQNTIDEYCQTAQELGYPLIAFTEHVRRNLDYDFTEYISQIAEAKKRYDLTVLGGCEAKVIDCDGNLDATDEVIKLSEIVVGVFHSFDFPGKNSYLKALKNMIQNRHVDVWGHPLAYAQKNHITLNISEIEEIVANCKKCQVLIENNVKYPESSHRLQNLAMGAGCMFVRGLDAHSVSELR